MYADRSLEIGEDGRQRAMKHSITLPLLGIMALLMRWRQGDKELNLGSVRRQLEWCWSTWTYTAPQMTEETYKLEVAQLLKDVDAAVNDFPWDAVKYKEDGWGEAMRLLEDREERRIIKKGHW